VLSKELLNSYVTRDVLVQALEGYSKVLVRKINRPKIDGLDKLVAQAHLGRVDQLLIELCKDSSIKGEDPRV
jgi:hypothetical protein